MVEPLPCIVCASPLPSVMPDSDNQPYAGTAFVTHGHYGSTAFDPLDGTFLEINVCDVCLVRAGLRGRVLLSRDRRPVMEDGVIVGFEDFRDEYGTWNPRREPVEWWDNVTRAARENGLLADDEELVS